MNRRGFLGKTIGVIAATGLPFVAQKAVVRGNNPDFRMAMLEKGCGVWFELPPVTMKKEFDWKIRWTPAPLEVNRVIMVQDGYLLGCDNTIIRPFRLDNQVNAWKGDTLHLSYFLGCMFPIELIWEKLIQGKLREGCSYTEPIKLRL